MQSNTDGFKKNPRTRNDLEKTIRNCRNSRSFFVFHFLRFMKIFLQKIEFLCKNTLRIILYAYYIIMGILSLD